MAKRRTPREVNHSMYAHAHAAAAHLRRRLNMAIKATRGNNKVIIKRKVIPNRLADTPQGVYYMMPYYMQARLQYIRADFMGLRHEAFIRNVVSLPDIFYGFMADKEYSELKIR